MQNQPHILIAEDDANIALALKFLLRRACEGVVIDVVNDGREALARIRTGDYALIISDWNMPHMTGMELLSLVRADARTAQLPFLMLTARADAASAAAVLDSAFSDYVAKPFDNHELVEKVCALFKASN